MRIANILEVRHDTLALRDTYTRIAESYQLEKVYDKVGEYYLNSLDLVSEKEVEERARLTEKIGVALLEEYMIDSSVWYLQTARSLYGETGTDDTHVLKILVRAYNRSGQFAEAIMLNEILFERYRKKQDFRQMSTLKNNIGYNLTLMGDYSNASLSFREAIDFGKKAGIPEQDLGHLMSNAGICYQNMNDTREARQFFQQALEYYEKYLFIRDSLQLQNKLKEQKTTRKRLQLEKSEKDHKIELKEERVKELAIQQLTLKLEKEEQEMRIKKEQEREIILLEKQKQLDRLELTRQKNAKKVLIVFIILGIFIMLLIIGSLISSKKKRLRLSRQKKEIEQKNMDLEDKNEEISAQRDEIEAQRDLVYSQKNEIEQYNQQERILNDTLVKWMRNIEQVDDICVMGLKLDSNLKDPCASFA